MLLALTGCATFSKDGGLDAFFFVGGAPAGAIAELASSGAGIEIVPLVGPEIDKLRSEQQFFTPDTITAGTSSRSVTFAVREGSAAR